jgi:predicted nucleic acid-binding protein
MMPKVLLDTNILLDFLLMREPFADDARSIIEHGVQGDYRLCATSNAMTDLFYIICKHSNTRHEAKTILGDICEFISVLDVTGADCDRAIASSMDDFEDAIAVESAFRNHVVKIITRDVHDFENSRVAAISSRDFLELGTHA